MRNMGFMLTTAQVLARTKTVTRRMGWTNLQPGQPLSALTDDVDYGFAECEREGFGDHPSLRWPSQFVEFQYVD